MSFFSPLRKIAYFRYIGNYQIAKTKRIIFIVTVTLSAVIFVTLKKHLAGKEEMLLLSRLDCERSVHQADQCYRTTYC